MKVYNYYLSILLSLFTIFLLLLLSFWIVCFKLPNYYKNEFVKYDIADNMNIKLDDLVDVNKQMLDYLLDKRESLDDITVNIDGSYNIKFFNEKEIAHMKDVKILFQNGIKLIYLSIICIAILSFLLFKKNIKTALLYFSKSIIRTMLFLLILLSIIYNFISKDFTKYFILFHKLFFSNDLWLLDPKTDRLINMLPEMIFMDITKDIIFCYTIFLTLLIIACIIIKRLFPKT